jgi:predicted ATP-grasp superfamily ATP-dependent carboligase
MDPESILSFNVNVSNLLPMVKMMEEQYRDLRRLERELTGAQNELHRILGGV